MLPIRREGLFFQRWLIDAADEGADLSFSECNNEWIGGPIRRIYALGYELGVQRFEQDAKAYVEWAKRNGYCGSTEPEEQSEEV